MAPLIRMGVSLLSLVSNSNHRNVGFKTSRQPYAKNRHTTIDISGDPQLPSFHKQHMMRTRLPCSYNAHSSTHLNLSQKAALTVAQSSGIGIEAIVSMSLLALQFGLQPSLTRKFTPKGITKSTVVLTQDVVKFLMAGFALFVTGGFAEAVVGWNVKTWLAVAGVPAVLYCFQNMATLIAYQNLSPLTFNVLNQTKTLSAALCCYLLMGRVQSKVQILSLFILFASACVIEKIVPIRFWEKNKESDDSNGNGLTSEVTSEKDHMDPTQHDNHSQGVIAVLLASFISGLAGAWAQKSLQSSSGLASGGRNSYLFTMELCVVSIWFMLFSLINSQDGKKISEKGFFYNWTPRTLIPIMTNAAGGIVVGLVSSHCSNLIYTKETHESTH